MNTTGFILFESSGKWTAPMRRQLRAFHISAQIVSAWPEFISQVNLAPASIVALECNAENFDETLRRLVEITHRFPDVRCLTLVERKVCHHDILLREAGAIHVQVDPRYLLPACRVIARHIRRAPQPVQSLTDQILGELPWS